ncbi:MAG TPA: hypothetical protein VGB24_17030 [Longimicrobium sp.]|uniref:hypothetical protein n=1 Tax=Longimicrobium sp. TaxID=2029185 RepID=UPI002ED81D40
MRSIARWIRRSAVAWCLGLALAPEAAAQVAPRDSVFRYNVKFVCGPYREANGVMALGQYFTAINVRNLSSSEVVIRKRFARSEPLERAGQLSPTFRSPLPAGRALNIGCQDIRDHAGVPPTAFAEGFAEIDSERQLEVTAVYTAGPWQRPGQTPSVSTMDVEDCRGVRVAVQPCPALRDSLHTGVANWRVVSDPAGSTQPYAAQVVAQPPSSWSQTHAAPARWVTGHTESTGVTVYEVDFCLCEDFADVRLDLAMLGDNQITEVRLNTNPVTGTNLPQPAGNPAGNFNGANLGTLSLTTGFVAGTNTLRVSVRNAGGATGLVVNARLRGRRGACPGGAGS